MTEVKTAEDEKAAEGGIASELGRVENNFEIISEAETLPGHQRAGWKKFK